jgi:iron complex outermembrane receptor protein
MEATARIGDTADGGGKETNTSLLFSSSSDKSSHTFVLDYFDREEILNADRYARRGGVNSRKFAGQLLGLG